ncbi:unnamed protein product, partial [Callosobruchus maculatus]
MRERERERREREKERETLRQRQRDREREKERERQRERQRETERERDGERDREREALVVGYHAIKIRWVEAERAQESYRLWATTKKKVDEKKLRTMTTCSQVFKLRKQGWEEKLCETT